MDGAISPEAGVKELCEYYLKRREKNVSSKPDADSIMYYIYGQQYICDLVKYNELDEEIIKPYVRVFIDDIFDNWGAILNAFPAQYLDRYISHIFVRYIKFIDDDNEKKEILTRIVYQRHVSTSIHINMVTKLACLMAEHMLADAPELFSGIWGWSKEQVIQHKKEILDYIRDAAYFHDIGKLSMGTVINQQTRKIMDEEFAIIKGHSSRGHAIAEMTGILKQYDDVIEGHHKSYDGKFGYPAGFDNTKSPVRPVIDLITIADCMDAATDNLGRNYHTCKTSDMMIQEIVDGGGTRYNPDMGAFISQKKKFWEQLTHLTREGRLEELYEIYQRFGKDAQS